MTIREATKDCSGECLKNKKLTYRRDSARRYAVQGHSRLPILVSFESSYATSISIWPAKKSKSAKKRKIKAIASFKVIQGHRGRYQSNARIRLPISD